MAQKKIIRGETEFTVYLESGEERWFWEMFEKNDWETATLDFMQNNLQGGYFLDIGAWIGPITLLMARHYDKIIAVDLDPKANERFFKNVSVNNFTNIEHFACGVGNKTEEIEIDANKLGSSETTIFDRASSNRIKVQIVRFDEFIGKIPDHEKIRFIKIDCEGAEYTFLDQVYRYMKGKNMLASLSFHPWVLKKPKYYFIKLFHWLKQLPFERYYFGKNDLTVYKRSYRPLLSFNGERFPMASIIKSNSD